MSKTKCEEKLELFDIVVEAFMTALAAVVLLKFFAV